MDRDQNGFTLIELIFVIIVIGILAIIAVPTWTATSVGLELEARRVLNDVRYTQMMSMATGERYRWVRLSGNSYSIMNETGSPIVLPSGGTVLVLSGGIGFGTFSNLPNNLIAFDSLGIPYVNSTLPGTVLATTGAIVLSSGSQTRSVLITPETGYGVTS